MGLDEAARLAALRRYRILDTEPERAFDDLTLLASYVCEAPIALISLVDEAGNGSSHASACRSRKPPAVWRSARTPSPSSTSSS